MTGRQTRTRQKYKDSCKHCACAKVKCSKDKPICARCSERGLTCSYDLSHRYGRLPAAAKLRSMAGDEHHQSGTTPPSPRALLPCQSAASSPSTDGGDFQYTWIDAPSPGLPLSTGSPTMYSGCMDFGYDQTIPQHFIHANYNGITSSMGPWSNQEFQAATPPTPDLALSVGSPTGALDFPQCLDSTSHANGAHDHSRSVSSAGSFPSGFEYPAAGFSPTPRTAFCTPPETPCQAFPSNNNASAAFSTRHDCLSLATTMLTTLKHSLISAEATSRKMIDQVLRMVECDCFSQDGHTRLLIVLIGLEIMARYSWTIQEESTETVLEDLQVVVKLIDRLLRRLREFTSSGSKSTVLSSSGSYNASDPTITISTAVFTQLEADLRDNLRGISNRAMNVLRRV
ncbi:hypothetical protein F5X96DRAFT_633607 [Biscogniauxia mediterranea]|nr:hypothetical protein F5X96DRAFT_633607 [Biscogniauxia mediterranea]